MIAPGVHETEVGQTFDTASGRFKTAVDADDYRLVAIRGALDGLETPTILDLGCGKGRFSRRLANGGARVVGLDLSTRMLAEAEGVERVRGTTRRLPFESRRFDAVVLVETLQHVADLDASLDEAARVLRPGGRLVVIDRNARALDGKRPWIPGLAIKWIDERRGRWIYPADSQVRERWFWPGRLAKALADRFEAVRVEHLLNPVEARSAVFRAIPMARAMTSWTAKAPGGDV